MSALRVQLVSKPTSPHTGIGRYAAELERGLRGADANLRIARLKNPLPRSAVSLGRRVGYDLEAFFHSYPIRADVRPGYVTHLTSQTLGILLLAQRLPRPVVVTVHDILPYLLRCDPDLNVYHNQAQRLLDALAMRGLTRADRLIAVSDVTKNSTSRALGIPDSKIVVVREAVDSKRFSPRDVPSWFMSKYDLPRDTSFVLYVGSNDPRKNLPALIASFAVAAGILPGVVLLLVGSHPFGSHRHQQMNIDHLARQLGVADRIRWFPDVPDEDIPVFYNLADVFVMVSKYEGFGLPALESMSCGTPVICSDIPSLREVAGDAATFVPPEDVQAIAAATIAVLSNHGLRQCLSARGLRRARSRTWSDVAAETLRVVRRLALRSLYPHVESKGET